MAVAALALGVMLAWSAPDGCPAEQAWRADIEALLGRSLATPFARWVDVHAVVRRAGAQYVLEISGDGSGGPFSRTLEDVSCAALADAAALIVALAIDPAVLESPPPPPPAPPPPAVTATIAATATIAPEVIDAPAAKVSAPLPFGLPWPRLGLSAFGAVDAGVIRGVGPGVLVAGAFFWRYLRLEGIVGYWFERAVRIDGSAIGADVSLIAAGGRACPTYPWVIEASVCVGIDLGQLRSDPVEVEAAKSRRLWGAAVGSLQLAWAPLDALALRLSGDAVLSVFRPSYPASGSAEIHRPALFGARASLGIEVRFF